MIKQTPIRISATNLIPTADLSGSVCATNRDWVKNEWGSRLAVYDDLVAGRTISGDWDGADKIVSYFSVIDSDLPPEANVRIQLYNSTTIDDANVIYDSGLFSVSDMIPLGEFMMGVDELGGTAAGLHVPSALTHWMPSKIVCKAFRFKFQAIGITNYTEAKFRTIMLGDYLQLEKNFSYGHQIRFLTPPELVMTAGGSNLPTRDQIRSRVMSLPLDQLTDLDRSRLWQLESTFMGEPILVSAHPDAVGWRLNNYTMMCRMTDALDFTQRYEDIHETVLNLAQV